MKSYPRRPQSKSQPSQEYCSPSPLVTVISLYSLSNLYNMHVYLASPLIQPWITHSLFLHSNADHSHLTNHLHVLIFTSVQGMCTDEVVSLQYWNTVGYARQTVLQRTVFINKIRMLQQTQMLQQTVFINKIRMLQQTVFINKIRMLQRTVFINKIRMLQRTVFINIIRMLQQTQMLQRTVLINKIRMLQRTQRNIIYYGKFN